MKKKNKEMFDNLYDRNIPKEAKWLAKKYKGEYGVIDIELSGVWKGGVTPETEKHFSIKITPEMIEAFKKEFPDESWSTMSADKLLENKRKRIVGETAPDAPGFAQPMYQQFPIPITAGLLATQGEEDNRTGLLQ